MKHSKIKETLKDLGIKFTRQRGAVICALQEVELPLTAEQLFNRVKEQDPEISLSTIYRVLDVLINNEVVQKTSFAGEKKSMYSLVSMEHRHYLVCTMCNRMEAIADCPLASYEKQLEEKTRYRISAHKLEIQGICPDCQKDGQGDGPCGRK